MSRQHMSQSAEGTSLSVSRSITAIRGLAIDMVEAARSGHPGMPLGAAPMAYTLFARFLRFNPDDPSWPNRDRFILSAGHGSALLYALLHLTGYPLSLADLEHFRQWGSPTPGHPEYGLTPGVETTTGPLGQGFATGVGLALAERLAAAVLNRDGFPLVDYRIFAIVSDGDLMEGISHEAASLAGHLQLGRLIYLYDDNRITIEGPTDLAFSEDVAARFAAYGWHTAAVEDGEDVEAITRAVAEAVADPRPSLIRVRTHIGYGSPHRQDTARAHGEPLGAEEAALTKAALHWNHPPFTIPADVTAHMRELARPGREAYARWQTLWQAYQRAHPAAARVADALFKGRAAVTLSPAASALTWSPERQVATRQASGQVLETLAAVPVLAGGAADLAPSTNTLVRAWADFRREEPGRNLHFGVREHAMAAALNGLALGGFRPYGGTFLVFADYLKPALRLAALQALPVIYVFTHDSIGLGEDGPTHQPVEQLASLRAVPNLWVIRPADAYETQQAWAMALARTDGPTALVLTRQPLPVLDPTRYPVAEAGKGAYVLREATGGAPTLLLLATGSEVHLALAAAEQLEAMGWPTRVVSMPCWEAFEAAPAAYRNDVLPPSVRARVGIEAAASLGWHRWVGLDGALVTLDRFGASAPGPKVESALGFTVDRVVTAARAVLARVGGELIQKGDNVP
jgi:transketolase